jgi:UDP-N-acetylglucosamine 1-carboxyvinyltransferase
MNSFKVEGGVKLSGDITPQGAKNEALQILCATLLTSEKVIIENVPEIIDVLRLIDLLKILGVEIGFNYGYWSTFIKIWKSFNTKTWW